MNPRRRRALHSLVVGLGCFIAGTVALSICLETSCDDLRDPEYGNLLSVLRHGRTEHADEPLILTLGTSRTANGVAPDEFPSGSHVFNFGLTGADSLERLIIFERLRRSGVRPDVLLVEVLPAHLTRGDGPGLIRNPNRLTANDLREVGQFTPAPWHDWAGDRLTPWSGHRFALVSRHVPSWLPWASRVDYLWKRDDPGGWFPDRRDITPAMRERGLQTALREYGPALQGFHVAPVQDRATRELLCRCQRDGIRVVLYLMPEGPTFRSWMPADAEQRLQAWLSDVQREFGVGVIDARCWLPEEAFADGHHLRADGARAFSQRFGEVLQARPEWPSAGASVSGPSSDRR